MCSWSGHIGYALAPLIARGQMCGPQQQVILRMHDREQAAQNLAAVQMELDDLASDLLLGKTSNSACSHTKVIGEGRNKGLR